MNEIVNFLQIVQGKRMDAEYWTSRHSQSYQKMLPLGDLCVFIRTGPAGSMLQSSMYQNQGIPVLRPSNLNQFTCRDSSLVYVSETYAKQANLYLYDSEDLLLSRIGDLKMGMICGFGAPVTISSNLFGLRVKRDLLDPYFLLAFLQSRAVQDQLLGSSKRVSLQTLGIDAVHDLRIPLIARKRQHVISLLVRQVLALRLETEEKIDTIQDYFSHIQTKNYLSDDVSFHTAFVDVQKAARMDAEFFLQSAGKGHYSLVGISAVPLSKIATFARGVEVGRTYYQEDGVPFWRVGNVSKIGFLPKSQKYIESALYERLKLKYQPAVEDLLVVKDGKPGVCMLMDEIRNGIVCEGIVRIRVHSLDPYYIAACINSEFCQRQIRKHLDGSLVPHWKMAQIRKLAIPVLSKQMQERIGSLMRNLYEMQRAIKHVEKSIREKINMLY